MKEEKEKVRCPYCGHPVNAMKGKGASCRGIFFKCKNKKCAKNAMPPQFVFDYVFQDLQKNHPHDRHIWDKSSRHVWDHQPITNQQYTLIHRLAPDYKIDAKKMTRGDASRLIQLLLYKKDELEEGADHAP